MTRTIVLDINKIKVCTSKEEEEMILHRNSFLKTKLDQIIDKIRVYVMVRASSRKRLKIKEIQKALELEISSIYQLQQYTFPSIYKHFSFDHHLNS